MNSPQRILICPLDWGLGHATRCIPIIKEIQKQGATPIVAAGTRQILLLKEEFPALEYIHFPGYSIHYANKSSMLISMLLQVPKILRGIYKEQQLLKQLLIINKIDGVISDNRFGLSSQQVPAIFMSHQVFIKAPVAFKFLEALIFRLNTYFIKKYKACWIPDYADGTTLSGELSHLHPLPEHYKFIGPLSRFQPSSHPSENPIKWELLVMLSGPEPQRSIFENMVLKQLANTSLQVLIVRGLPGAANLEVPSKNCIILNHLPSKALQAEIEAAKLVLCRPGYSSLMDLAVLNKKAVFVPTPGQTEQEYLATYFANKNLCAFQQQENFDLNKLMAESHKVKGLNIALRPDLLKNAVQDFLSTCAEK
jgi:uncharacterized protein (TIGR00661 family)